MSDLEQIKALLIENKLYILPALLGLVFIFLLMGKGGEKQMKRKERSEPVALSPDEWKAFPLIKKETISHDVRLFRFGLPSPGHRVGLPIGQHISFKYTDENGNDVQRSYTPVSSDDELGYIDFVIKVYFKNPPRFPDGGKMSQHVESLKIGDTLLMKGPKGKVEYLGRGQFTITLRGQSERHKVKKIGMIAGGTGITPMLQIIRAIAKDPKDHTEVWLIFANQTQEDILVRKELEAVATSNPRFHLWYTLDRPPTDGSWKYSTGFINKEMCRAHLPTPDKDTFLFNCGPPIMIEKACEPAFRELGFEEEQWCNF